MSEINAETSPVDKVGFLLGLTTSENITINGTKYIVAAKFYHWHSDEQNARYILEVKLFNPVACISLKTDKPVSTASFSTHVKSGDYVFVERTKGYHQVLYKHGNIDNTEHTITVETPVIPVFQ